jgi:hypothetical protein
MARLAGHILSGRTVGVGMLVMVDAGIYGYKYLRVVTDAGVCMRRWRRSGCRPSRLLEMWQFSTHVTSPRKNAVHVTYWPITVQAIS